MKRRFLLVAVAAGLVGGAIYFRTRVKLPSGASPAAAKPTLSRKEIARLVEKPLSEGRFPKTVAGPDEHQWLEAHYSLYEPSQTAMESLLQRYGPDYGAFVALDATTGRLLTLVSFTRGKKSELGNLALKALFPAASIFKIVTATAALETARLTPDTEIPFKGGNHTLYRRNVYDDSEFRARRMTVREAFAKSVNVVFAKLGLFFLTPSTLVDYANRFLFNQAIASDVPLQEGKIDIPFDRWSVAELASGFTRDALMSPLQGAIMASAVVNDGVMMEPFVVDLLKASDGTTAYQGEPRPLSRAMTADTAKEMRELMRETVARGTSRKWFRGFRGKDWEVGGKTGSLTSLEPRGKTDWFVGYATDGTERLALAALTVNEHVWRVKASYLARAFLDQYLKGRKP